MSFSTELMEHIAPIVASDPKLLSECDILCKTYGISPESLKYKWEALMYNTANARSIEIQRFTMDSIASLKSQLISELNRQTTAKRTAKRVPMSGFMAVNRNKVAPFKNRNMGVARSTAVNVKTEEIMAGPSKVTFQGPQNDPESRRKRAYRYMYEKPLERGNALDREIEEFSLLICEHYNIPENGLGDPSALTDNEVIVVGRITHDIELSNTAQKLTERQLMLEPSRRSGSGKRVPLRFDAELKIRGGPEGSKATGLFSGALVAVKGKNGGGGTFMATEILMPPPPKPGTQPLRKMADDAFTMCIASGPFTPESNLLYSPLQTLLKQLKALPTRPAVTLLIGPFVDASHPILKEGDTDDTPLSLFHRRVLEPLREYFDDSPGCIAVLVPSVRDLITSHAVYPQSEFEREVSRNDHRIHLIPNPGTFTIDGVSFGVTSVDVVMHLKKQEFLKSGDPVESVATGSQADNGTDAFANTCRHLLLQRSFYPLFPVPQEYSNEVNLDVSHSERLRLSEDETAPDVLILPSRLKHFTKSVYHTTAVNPSSLGKQDFMLLDVTPGATDIVNTRMEKLETE